MTSCTYDPKIFELEMQRDALSAEIRARKALANFPLRTGATCTLTKFYAHLKLYLRKHPLQHCARCSEGTACPLLKLEKFLLSEPILPRIIKALSGDNVVFFQRFFLTGLIALVDTLKNRVMFLDMLNDDDATPFIPEGSPFFEDLDAKESQAWKAQ